VSARSLVSLWLPPFVLMAVIFLLSAQPDLNSGLGVIDTIGRKLVHAGEYALLCVLWWRALRTVVRPRAAAIVAVAVALAYAATDEVHQTFVHGRHGTPIDVLIDAAGAIVAAVFLRRREERARRGRAERVGATASRAA
jgi:VanZ family protein